MAYGLRAFDWIGLLKRPSVAIFALFFAALLSTIPINTQKLALKFFPFGSNTNNNGIQKFQPGDLVYVAHTANERSQVFDKDGKFVFHAGVADNDNDQWNRLSVGWGQATFIFNGYFQLPAIACRQIVDQISYYRFTLF